MSAPLAILNFKSTSRPLRAAKYFADASKVIATCDCLAVGTMDNATLEEIVESILSGHHDPHTASRVCRTAVISVKTPKNATAAERAELAAAAVQGFKDLCKKLGVAGVAWAHGNTQTIHIHGLFPNSDGRRTLDLSPELLRELQGFQWTKALAPGRGKGRRKALPVYPNAKNLLARDLAGQILGDADSITPERWEQLLASGLVTAPRRRRDGSLISFAFAGRRIRASTLEGFVCELANTNNQPRKKKTMIAITQPSAPLAPDLARQIQDAGFVPDAFAALLNEFNRSRSAHTAARDCQPKPQNQQPPTK